MDITTIISLPIFFLIPFLGGNHLPLYYITIDKFWIESFFILFLIFAIVLCHFKKKDFMIVSTPF